MKIYPCVQEDLDHLKELIEPFGGVPSSVQITVAKLHPASPTEGKHVRGHHVGSWGFRAR